MSANLTYGIDTDGRLRHVNDVANGLKCNCRCPNPDCNVLLVAKNEGKFKDHHFAHYEIDQCGGALESMLHKLSKQIIRDHSALIMDDGKLFQYQTAESEKRVELYRADIELNGTDGQLFVEIVVSNDLIDSKIDFFERSQKRVLVIDLSLVDRDIKIEQLQKLLLETPDGRYLIEPKQANISPSLSNSNTGCLVLFGGLTIAIIGWLLC